VIVVRVELHSAITGKVIEIARAHIANEGVSQDMKIGDYRVATLTGRNNRALDRNIVNRAGFVRQHRRLDQHVWHLVSKALQAVGYGK